MLGFDQRSARIAWTVALVALGLYLVCVVRHTALIFVLALFFSYMLHPLVRRISGLAPPRFPTSFAAAIVFALLLTALAGIAALIGPPIIEQASALSERLPALTDGSNVFDRLPLPE